MDISFQVFHIGILDLLLKKDLHIIIFGVLFNKSQQHSEKIFSLNMGYFLNYKNNACDYHLWKKFAKISKLETYYIKIGYFRSWPGQNSKVQERKYYSDTGIKKYFISLRHIRLVASLFMLPYFYLNSLYVLSKYKLTK